MKIPIKDDRSVQKKLTAARKTVAYQLESAIGTFGDELWQAMEQQKLTQAELARKAGVSRQFLTKVFRGDNNFTLETMVKLAHAVGQRLHHHLAPAELDCEWHHFYPTQRESNSARPLPALTFTEDQPVNGEKTRRLAPSRKREEARITKKSRS